MSEQHALCQETSQGDAPPSWSPLPTTLSAATGRGQGADPWGQAGGATTGPQARSPASNPRVGIRVPASHLSLRTPARRDPACSGETGTHAVLTARCVHSSDRAAGDGTGECGLSEQWSTPRQQRSPRAGDMAGLEAPPSVGGWGSGSQGHSVRPARVIVHGGRLPVDGAWVTALGGRAAVGMTAEAG